ncbi:DNA-directed RNA polymerase II subunit RPB1-like isoform X1 [Zophobas morio]|uniref:DNA-directed RNA polymerase II subunit RPB1-like isoform X1 n=1 Tax=Zophobas morio TaxID=2755281 RepID=UPI003082A37C
MASQRCPSPRGPRRTWGARHSQPAPSPLPSWCATPDPVVPFSPPRREPGALPSWCATADPVVPFLPPRREPGALPSWCRNPPPFEPFSPPPFRPPQRHGSSPDLCESPDEYHSSSPSSSGSPHSSLSPHSPCASPDSYQSSPSPRQSPDWSPQVAHSATWSPQAAHCSDWSPQVVHSPDCSPQASHSSDWSPQVIHSPDCSPQASHSPDWSPQMAHPSHWSPEEPCSPEDSDESWVSHPSWCASSDELESFAPLAKGEVRKRGKRDTHIPYRDIDGHATVADFRHLGHLPESFSPKGPSLRNTLPFTAAQARRQWLPEHLGNLALPASPCSGSESPGSTPQKLPAYSLSSSDYSGSPCSPAGSPAAYSRSPSAYSGSPSAYSGSPSAYSGSPSAYSGSPSSYSGSPCSPSGSPSPHSRSLSPYSRSPSPHSRSSSPRSRSPSPRSRSPSPYSRSPSPHSRSSSAPSGSPGSLTSPRSRITLSITPGYPETTVNISSDDSYQSADEHWESPSFAVQRAAHSTPAAWCRASPISESSMYDSARSDTQHSSYFSGIESEDERLVDYEDARCSVAPDRSQEASFRLNRPSRFHTPPPNLGSSSMQTSQVLTTAKAPSKSACGRSVKLAVHAGNKSR